MSEDDEKLLERIKEVDSKYLEYGDTGDWEGYNQARVDLIKEVVQEALHV